MKEDDSTVNPPLPSTVELIGLLQEARERTLGLLADLADDQLFGPHLDIINPLLWEIGHVAWFQEKWSLRHLRGAPPLLEQADALYDSFAVAHDTRWDLPLINRQDTLAYMQQVLKRVVDSLVKTQELSQEEFYFHWLPLLHEDMHCEAFAYTRQTLEYSAPLPEVYGPKSASPSDGEPLPGDVEFAGGSFLLGAPKDLPFVFDNEKWAHPVDVAPFAMARAAVSQGEFRAFVEDSGYSREECWSTSGWQWRLDFNVQGPLYWRREGKNFSRRVFDSWVPLEEHQAMVHVGWYEAEAYCCWAGCRLPTEAEWEFAAGGLGKRRYPWGDEPDAQRANLDGRWGGPLSVNALPQGKTPEGCRQMMGNVWEWTASDFMAYPGFVADPYSEYSEPWFGDHKVLRGGCWATRFRLLRNTLRNFYTPDRRDVWAGFRTCRDLG